ncbi:MAG: hypothetical protein QM764_20130 [Chitinophagaceae bacterium]
MKFFATTVCFFLLLNIGRSQPYVFYQGDSIIVKTLDSPSVHIDSFPISEKKSTTLQSILQITPPGIFLCN